jgi:hypothetical protein
VSVSWTTKEVLDTARERLSILARQDGGKEETHNFAILTTGCFSPSLSASTEYPVLCQSMMILLPLRKEAS